ncbi:MAG: hypothetical protein WCR06_01295 [bacterium]
MSPSNAAGGVFSPTSKSFSKVIANKTCQNFAWTAPAAVSKPTVAAVASVAIAPVVLLRTYGTVRWSGANATQAWQAADLLFMAVSAGEAVFTLPVAVAQPGDMSATANLEPALLGVTTPAGEDALIFRNSGGVVTMDTLLPNAAILGSATFVPVGADVVLTWDLTLLK